MEKAGPPSGLSSLTALGKHLRQEPGIGPLEEREETAVWALLLTDCIQLCALLHGAEVEATGTPLDPENRTRQWAHAQERRSRCSGQLGKDALGAPPVGNLEFAASS